MPTLPLLRSTMSLTHLPRLRSCVFPTLVRFPILLHPVAAASLDATEVSPLRVLRFKDLPPSRIHNLVEFRSAILSINSRTHPGPTRCSKRYVLPESVLTSRRHTLRSLLRFRSQPMLGVTLGFRRPHPLWSLIGTTQSTSLSPPDMFAGSTWDSVLPRQGSWDVPTPLTNIAASPAVDGVVRSNLNSNVHLSNLWWLKDASHPKTFVAEPMANKSHLSYIEETIDLNTQVCFLSSRRLTVGRPN